MKKLTFKTNINCGGCVAKVTPHLNNASYINSWNVDTNNPNKILTIETAALVNAQQIINLVQEIGFYAEEFLEKPIHEQ